MTDMVRELGIRVTNDLGLPVVQIERPVIVKETQFFKVTTEKQYFEFYVTRKGYIRVQAVKPVQARGG